MIEIVPMGKEHIGGMVEVEENCFTTPWTEADFRRELTENKLAIYRVAVEDGKVLGYAGMWHVVTEGQITNVAVLPEHRRRGIGDRLMETMIALAQEREMIGITLEVRTTNEPAQRLYIKYGFRPEGIRKGYYQDTKEDAVIMWKYFPIYEGYEEVEKG